MIDFDDVHKAQNLIREHKAKRQAQAKKQRTQALLYYAVVALMVALVLWRGYAYYFGDCANLLPFEALPARCMR